MGGGEGYVRKVQESTQKYLEELLAQGNRMRSLVEALETEKERLSEELDKVRQELTRQQGERETLRNALREMEGENRRFVERFSAVQQQNDNLANLYVASFRLHGTLDRAEVVATIQEIVANLIGCEELALYEQNSDGSAFELAHAVGIEAGSTPTPGGDRGIVARVIRSGEKFVRQDGLPEYAQSSEEHLTACIPLVLGTTVIGALALFRLLPQKAGGYQEVDYELMDLLATHAAMALYCSSRLPRS